MKGLQKFSTRGLRFFESTLLILGSLLLPITLLTESSFVRFSLGFVYIAIFAGFYLCEKAINRKPGYKMKKSHAIKPEILRTQCLNKIEQYKGLSQQHNIHHSMNSVSMGERLTIQLNKCETLAELMEFKELLTEELLGLIKQIQRKEQHNRDYSQSYTREESKTPVVSIQSSNIKESLQVLNLPENTRDFVKIKSAYKQLIKKYHPDVNQTEEADNKTVQLNLAFEYLKETLEVS